MIYTWTSPDGQCRNQIEVKPEEINSEYSLEGLKLKLQYFGHLIYTTNSLKRTLMLGQIEGKRKKG